MKLVITEKPSVAIAIAAVIGATKKKDGYIEGNGYIISWCVGHLVGLANPDMYDEKFKKWRYEDLPIIPKKWDFTLNPSTKKQFEVLRELIKSTEVDEIIEATDAGREGELIFRLVYDMIAVNKPFKRLWISSMEETSILNGFKNLKNGEDYQNLYESALARSKADWMVGMNATRLFTTIYNTKLSVGRVQTPTLAMIANRDHKIKNFIKEKFYNVELDLGSNFKVKSENRINEKKETESIKEYCDGKTVTIIQVEKAVKNKKPPLLFDLTTLQREANNLFGYTAKQTLDIVQSLYEKKLVTYPRTDSRYITDDMEESVLTLIKEIDNTFIPNLKRLCDNKKVTDHHAIIPTKQSLSLDFNKISKEESNVYITIKSKLIIAASSNYIYEQTNVIATVDDYLFTKKGKIVVDEGFVLKENEFKKNIGLKVKEIEEEELPDIKENDKYNIKEINIIEGLTTPPKHYTEDTLLGAMENAGVEDLDKNLDTEKKGLGTPATRANIIEKLIKTNYVIREKKNLLITEKGNELIKVMPDNIKSAKLTAEWENKLTEISNGNLESEKFLLEIQDAIKSLINNYKNFEGKNNFEVEINHKGETLGKCPKCQSDIYESEKNFYCSNKACKFALWKKNRFFEQKKKKITKTIAKELLKNGKAEVSKLFSEKKDKYYNATIVMVISGDYVNFKLEF